MKFRQYSIGHSTDLTLGYEFGSVNDIANAFEIVSNVKKERV